MRVRRGVEAIVDRGMIWLLVAWVFVIPIFWWSGGSGTQSVKFTIALLGIAVLVAVWAFVGWLRASWIVRAPWVLIPWGVLVAVAALSLVPATVPCLALQGIVAMIAFASLALVTASVVRTLEDARWLVTAIASTAVIAAVYGLVQYFGVGTGGGGAEAARSFFGGPRALANFLASAVVPCTILAARWRSTATRVASLVAIALLAFTAALVGGVDLVLSMAVAIVAVGVGLLVLGRRAILARERVWRTAALALIVIAVALGAVLSAVDVAPGGTSAAPDGRPASSGDPSWRSVARRSAWAIFTERPLLGAGLGHFEIEAPEAVASVVEPGSADGVVPAPAKRAESDLLQAGAETGILGLLALLALLLSLPTFVALRLRRTSDADGRLDLLALFAGTIAFLAQAVISSPMHLASPLIVLAVVVGISSAPAYGGGGCRRLCLERWRLTVGAFAVVAVTVLGAVLAVRDLSAEAHLRAGIGALERGETASAEGEFTQSIALDLCPREALFHRATTRLYSADESMSRGAFAEAAAVYEEARADLERCTVRFPRAEVYLSLANLGLRLEDVPTMRVGVTWLVSFAVGPDLRVQGLYLDALLAKREGDTDRATTVLRAAIDEFPSYVRTYIALADLELARDRTDEARALYEEALARAEAKLAEAESHLAEDPALSASERAFWSRARREAGEEIDVARRALSSFEIPTP
ncbi:MAG: O-antigen ligase family protein [Candidatus Bipolaricaulota bacterium]|nr:MAG: O-antigen ligase family protein [Candidatus Bipolaricaulota bacterium]